VHAGWELACELSKLLSKDGDLVAMQAEAAARHAMEDSNWYSMRQLYFSYLARMPDGENLAIKMLDIVTDDFRDGLFLACYRIRTPRIFNKLERCFLEWIAADVTWGQGTGEIYCLKKFIDLWQELKVPFNQRLKDFVIEDAKRWGYPVPWESESTGEGMV
jgi:hypothetical protein